MIANHLATYLNDHLAGSMAAIELLEHVEKMHPDNSIGVFARALQTDIVADRKELENLMSRCDVAQSLPRKVSAWLGEKAARLKLRVDDHANGSFALFESIEAISLGIEGKRCLWIALKKIAGAHLELAKVDYDRLIARAEEQRARAEIVRLDIAHDAFIAVP